MVKQFRCNVIKIVKIQIRAPDKICNELFDYSLIDTSASSLRANVIRPRDVMTSHTICRQVREYWSCCRLPTAAVFGRCSGRPDGGSVTVATVDTCETAAVCTMAGWRLLTWSRAVDWGVQPTSTRSEYYHKHSTVVHTTEGNQSINH